MQRKDKVIHSKDIVQIDTVELQTVDLATFTKITLIWQIYYFPVSIKQAACLIENILIYVSNRGAKIKTCYCLKLYST